MCFLSAVVVEARDLIRMMLDPAPKERLGFFFIFCFFAERLFSYSIQNCSRFEIKSQIIWPFTTEMDSMSQSQPRAETFSWHLVREKK